MKLPPLAMQVATIPDLLEVAGKNPSTLGDDGKFYVSRPMVEDLERYGPQPKFWDTYLVPDALEAPSAILEGLKRPNFEDGFCYSLLPEYRWTDEVTKISPPPLKVFCVYVHPDPNDGRLIVLDWDWRFMSLKESGLPNNWRKCFTRMLWPTT